MIEIYLIFKGLSMKNNWILGDNNKIDKISNNYSIESFRKSIRSKMCSSYRHKFFNVRAVTQTIFLSLSLIKAIEAHWHQKPDAVVNW